MSAGDAQSDRDPLPLDIQQLLDRVRDEFARAWQPGAAVRIEEYLDRVPSAWRARLLKELLVVEFNLCHTGASTLDIGVYRQRFPGYDDVVRAALTQHERREGAAIADDAEQSARNEVDEQAQPLPERIGRFPIRRRLGRGGFGVVYLAYDPGLDRLVALKVSRPELLATGEQRDSFLHEARTTAKLKHPALVTVYEVQQEADQIYIVQEYIEGQNLAQWAAAQPRSWEEIARRLIEIATAIGYVHQQGFYHRDLKPANILVDAEGHAHVADFGLAVHEDVLRLLKGQASGTPPYMSPEQVRGETHWIDGRSDIWALGVILYELLAGHRPFTATNMADLSAEIQEREPQPPRMRRPDIPKELERICLKCLAKRRAQRYTTAQDLLEDLQAFLTACPDSAHAGEPEGSPGAQVESGSGVSAPGSKSTVRGVGDSTPWVATPVPDSSALPLKIVPKGLRPFDKEDKDFFLELLPGPRDRDGLPDSIRFWKARLEELEAEATFPVGVLYGPTGCGKSSLVKAGLLPRVAAHVLPVFVEATPHDTELRLLKQLRKRIPGLTADAPLADVLTELREGHISDDRKVVLVLDQFEQWLHGAEELAGSELVCALRQCDGANLQGLVLVRSDFWMSTTRFMQALETAPLEGMNSEAVDLFDPTHARKVLRAFGLAYGRLPEHDLSAEQQRFLDQAVQELAYDGKVVCAQLSLFADMMKSRDWTADSLEEAGGMLGTTVVFLDEMFTAKTAPPAHRVHATAAQAVLKALLPEVGTDIKEQMQSVDRLRRVSGYANRADDYRRLIQILDAELRLITPSDPEGDEVVAADDTGAGPLGAESRSAASPPSGWAGTSPPRSASSRPRCYQLTHDYLVPSLHEWLSRRHKQTRRGRAQLWLAERAAIWNGKPERRNLPSLFEFISIRALTKSRLWIGPERTMMRAAGRYYGSLAAAGFVAILLVAVGIQQFFAHARRKANQTILQEQRRSVVAAVDNLQNGQGPAVPLLIRELQRLPQDMVVAELRTRFDRLNEDRRLPLAYALADPAFGNADRPFLIGAIPSAPVEERDNIVVALTHDRERALADLKSAAAAATAEQDWKRKTRLATVALCLGDLSIAAEMLQAEPPVVEPDQMEPPHRAASQDRPPDPGWKEALSALAAAVGWPRSRPPATAWDPVQRTAFIDWFPKWSGNVEELVPVLEAAEDPSLLSGMSLALGSIPEVTADAKRTWGPLFARWHSQHPHGAVHSASGWALRSWELTVPTIAPDNIVKRGYGWQVTPTGLTLIRIPAGQIERPESQAGGEPRRFIRVDRAFWISDREITTGQLLTFLDDPTAEKPVDAAEVRPFNSGDPARAAANISWYDAVLFCNWLSDREGRQRCYRKEGKERFGLPDNTAREYDVWQLSLTANGYRLPMENEWEYACRARTTTGFSFGDDEELLERYGTYVRNQRNNSPSPAGSKLCNAWGLFDMHGNVWECCQDWYEEGTSRVYRGGSWFHPATYCQSDSRNGCHPAERSYHWGFRVVLGAPGEARQAGAASPTEP